MQRNDDVWKQDEIGKGENGYFHFTLHSSNEQFFVLACLIDRASASSKEGAKAAREASRHSGDFAHRSHDRILNDVSRFIDAVDYVLAHAIETLKLYVQCLAGIGDHCFDTPELVPCGQANLDKI